MVTTSPTTLVSTLFFSPILKGSSSFFFRCFLLIFSPKRRKAMVSLFFVGTPLFLFSKSFKSISFFGLVKRGCLGTIISKEFLIGNEANENEKKSALSKKNLTITKRKQVVLFDNWDPFRDSQTLKPFPSTLF